ncbi:MAG TPA: 4'-phosphopantetheinyl transferase superfamily protein, partial [Actinomycetes bacterium]|nr:4'-phosphopantetheinyl transferase superfamily protein [Actinomycetes bacterium]
MKPIATVAAVQAADKAAQEGGTPVEVLMGRAGAAVASAATAELEAATRRGVGEVAYLAKRWAAKEATSKALGVGFSGFAYTEIEVTNLP